MNYLNSIGPRRSNIHLVESDLSTSLLGLLYLIALTFKLKKYNTTTQTLSQALYLVVDMK